MSDIEAPWRKSSYSGGGHQNCVEVALPWHKSSYSGNVNQNCVEVAHTPSTVLLRDTQHRHLGHLTVPAAEWAAFLAEVEEL